MTRPEAPWDLPGIKPAREPMLVGFRGLLVRANDDLAAELVRSNFQLAPEQT